MVWGVLMWMSVWTVQTSVHTTVTTLRAHLCASVVKVMFWSLMVTAAKSQVYIHVTSKSLKCKYIFFSGCKTDYVWNGMHTEQYTLDILFLKNGV